MGFMASSELKAGRFPIHGLSVPEVPVARFPLTTDAPLTAGFYHGVQESCAREVSTVTRSESSIFQGDDVCLHFIFPLIPSREGGCGF